MEIPAELEELALLRREQILHDAVAPGERGNDANLVHPLAALLRERVESLRNDLRCQPRHAEEDMALQATHSVLTKLIDKRTYLLAELDRHLLTGAITLRAFYTNPS